MPACAFAGGRLCAGMTGSNAFRQQACEEGVFNARLRHVACGQARLVKADTMLMCSSLESCCVRERMRRMAEGSMTRGRLVVPR